MKFLSSLHIYFFVIFEMHYMVFRYNVCLEEYMDLSPRLRSGTTSEDIDFMRKTRWSGSQILSKIILSYTLEYKKI